MNEVNKMDRALFDQVPSEIVLNILSRLPTKTCLNCKLVCKEWYQIIVSIEFDEHRSKHCPYSTIMLRSDSALMTYEWSSGDKANFLLFDIDKSSFNVDEMGNLIASVDAMVSFKPKFNIPFNTIVDFINECNGLVLYSSWGQRDFNYIVCNLLTGEQVIVRQCHEPCCIADYVLGCSPVSQQFKVLRRICKEGALEIKTLGSNEWRTVGRICPYIKKLSTGVFLHGSLHQCSRKHNIWSFNFEREQFLEFPMPKELEVPSGRPELDVFVLKSHLCLTACKYSTKECKIWMMKEYGVKESWVQQYVIQTEKSHPCMPLLHLNNDKMLFNYLNRVYLGESHTENGSWKEVKIREVSSFKVIVPYHVKFSKLP